MDSLKRLIARLTCPRNISNEDAFDTVKQYWEDVTSGYWQDTDEELADELGVTPTALAELLEVHRHTFNYANVGGNSSVRGYDHGEDWLVVMFSDGSRYLYTLKSTDRQTLDYMRRLAMAGKGLNSYITRIVGPNYAGRNYKGTITIKPGMEQYNPEGYRRLLLIQAFRNTMTIKTVTPNQATLERYKEQITTAGADGLDPVARGIMTVGLEAMGYSTKVSTESIDDQPVNATQTLEGIVDQALTSVGKSQVSNEGIWGAVRYLFGGNYEDIPDIRNVYDEVIETVKRTYGNPEWVNGRKLNNGEVKIKSGIDAVTMGIAKALKQVSDEYVPILEKNTIVLNKEKDYLAPFIKFLNTGSSDEKKASDLLRIFKDDGLGNFIDYPNITFGGSGKAEALNAEGILKQAETFDNILALRRNADLIWSSGFYKMAYTDTGKYRYGRDGTVTSKLSGDALKLSLRVGEYLSYIEEAYYASITKAWPTLTNLAQASLGYMEESAK